MKSTKISEPLRKIFSDLGISMIISEELDYIDLGDDETFLTYTPLDKIKKMVEKEQDPWKTNRVSMKIGKFFNKMFYIEGTQLENLVNWYKTIYSVYKGDYDKIFEVVEGEDIRHWYNEKNYVTGGGSLNNSCMRGESSQGRLDLYVENPNVCKLLIMKEGDRLAARSLMWTTDQGIYLDRTYCRYDKDQLLYKKYAEHMNYKSYYNRAGAGMGMSLKVVVKKTYKIIPYLDSFGLTGKTLTAYV